MAETTISFPKELKLQIEAHPEINWSEVFRKAAIRLLHRLSLIEFLENKLINSKFTEEDAERLGELAKKNRIKDLKSRGIV